MKWTKTKPTKPGWYWCRNVGDQPATIWEAVVRVDISHEGVLRCGWMTAPGKVGVMSEYNWNPDALWCGPISPPKL